MVIVVGCPPHAVIVDENPNIFDLDIPVSIRCTVSSLGADEIRFLVNAH